VLAGQTEPSALFGIADKDPDYARLALRVGDKGTVRRPRPDTSTTSYRTRKTGEEKKSRLSRPVLPDWPNSVQLTGNARARRRRVAINRYPLTLLAFEICQR